MFVFITSVMLVLAYLVILGSNLLSDITDKVRVIILYHHHHHHECACPQINRPTVGHSLLYHCNWHLRVITCVQQTIGFN